MSASGGAHQGAGRFYGKESFNPRKILAQMTVLQSAWYLLFVSTVSMANHASGMDLSASQFFVPSAYTFHTKRGVTLIFGQWICSLIFAPFLSFIIERAKKVLDFCVTIQFWHLVLCIFSHEFPGLAWWGVSLVGCVVGTLLSEAICMRWELQDIELGGNNKYAPVATVDHDAEDDLSATTPQQHFAIPVLKPGGHETGNATPGGPSMVGTSSAAAPPVASASIQMQNTNSRGGQSSSVMTLPIGNNAYVNNNMRDTPGSTESVIDAMIDEDMKELEVRNSPDRRGK
ncbi:unnamed protein product [Amoebophrya sp. A25]|nr:unnamed protein product [Amoebophrya sp. A25]|eukprot:GSA25T00015629001.1